MLNRLPYHSICGSGHFVTLYSLILTTKIISGADTGSPSELATNEITWLRIPPNDVT